MGLQGALTKSRFAISRLHFPFRRWIAAAALAYALGGVLCLLTGIRTFGWLASKCATSRWIGDGAPLPIAATARFFDSFTAAGGSATWSACITALAAALLLFRWRGAGYSASDGRPEPDGVYAGLLIFVCWWSAATSPRWFEIAFLSGRGVSFPDRISAWLCGPDPWRSSLLCGPCAFCALLALLHGLRPRYFTAHFLFLALVITTIDIIASRATAISICTRDYVIQLVAGWPALIGIFGILWLRSDSACEYTAWHDR